MKKKSENQKKIDDAKAITKEKVAYGLAMGLFAIGAVAWGASIGFGFAGVLKVHQMFLSMLASMVPSALGFVVGTAGARASGSEMEEELPRLTKKELDQFTKESEYNEEQYGK